MFSSNTVADTKNNEDDQKWTIHFSPGIRWGTDNRTLYILDFLVPLYQDERNILFVNAKYTPNDLNGWETNLGLGYRHILIDEYLLLGINGFYDWRKTPWGTRHTQWGVGAEVMVELGILEDGGGLGLTGRFNYYQPLTDAIVEVRPRDSGSIQLNLLSQSKSPRTFPTTSPGFLPSTLIIGSLPTSPRS
ncbi:MAG: inverse autotransporter beta domain-containing protein [Deltaproteobacteria bacterium]|uniref:Inverse autotransporter beta domain-containing protein n=1 Tax=Candidatus Zymogenus saltonus TaxID=2844893 RepID=A0A9D8PQY4_9DELT|nr:inverse autotransporter beta domain-containing protein [Candidatus Zymogenus saltonus]